MVSVYNTIFKKMLLRQLQFRLRYLHSHALRKSETPQSYSRLCTCFHAEGGKLVFNRENKGAFKPTIFS